MKFVSKSSNLQIILKNGLAPQPLSGFPGRPTVSVRFQNGMADVSDQELINLMLSHNGFGRDFVSAEETKGVDPYAYRRQDVEPVHQIVEMKFGTPVSKKTAPGQPKELPVEIKKLIQEQATAIAKQMLPSMVEETLKVLVNSRQPAATTSSTKKSGKRSPGRPRKAPTPQSVVTASPETVTSEEVLATV